MSKSTDPRGGAVDPVDAAVREWTDEQERAVTRHPGVDELVDYQEGRLDASHMEQLQRHLLACSNCRGELLLLQELDLEPEQSELPSEEAAARNWRRFQEARALDRRATRSGAALTPVTRWLVAASFALALATGALLGAVFVGRLAPSGPTGGGSPFVFDLDPAGARVLREASDLQEIVVPRQMDPLVARLNLGDLTTYDDYVVEAYNERQQLLFSRDGLVRNRSGSITFLIPRASWPAGDYRVLLFATASGERRELASYALRLRYAT